jgi:leucyl aminopeptidase
LTRGISKVITPCHDDGCVTMIACLPNDDDASIRSGSGMAVTAAVARALPVYTRKGNRTATDSNGVITIAIRFGSVPFEDQVHLDQFQHVADGIRTAAGYVDAPCNEMHASVLAQCAVDLCQGLPSVTIEQVVGDELEQQGKQSPGGDLSDASAMQVSSVFCGD